VVLPQGQDSASEADCSPGTDHQRSECYPKVKQAAKEATVLKEETPEMERMATAHTRTADK